MKKKKIAIIGTNGLPAKYGGYETLVNNLTLELGNKFEIIVYCSITPRNNRLKYYNNAKLLYLPLKANGWQSILYDIICTFHSWLYAEVLLILGPAAGFILPLNRIFRKIIIVNHGGLNEWEREKFSPFERFLAKINHQIAAKSANYNIADNTLLKESLKKSFNCDSLVIRYGGDHAKKVAINNELLPKYPFLKDKYAVSVSRAQVDNNLHLALEAFETFNGYKIVLVSNWQISSYGQDLWNKFKNHPNIILLDSVYNSEEINAIRGNAFLYIHTHSRCGTSPSLVEAMSINIPVICYDVPTNRETTHNKSKYFKNSDDLVNILNSLDDKELLDLKSTLFEIANKEYTWQHISQQYERIFNQ